MTDTLAQYLTVEEAAARAAVSEHTIRSWLTKGWLASAQAAPRGRHLIAEPDLAALLKPQRHGDG